MREERREQRREKREGGVDYAATCCHALCCQSFLMLHVAVSSTSFTHTFSNPYTYTCVCACACAFVCVRLVCVSLCWCLCLCMWSCGCVVCVEGRGGREWWWWWWVGGCCVCRSLRGVLQDSWNWTALSGKANDWRNRARVVPDLFSNLKFVRSSGYFRWTSLKHVITLCGQI